MSRKPELATEATRHRVCTKCGMLGRAYKTRGSARFYKCQKPSCGATWKVIFRPAKIESRGEP